MASSAQRPRTALITGASAGIGRAFAAVYAQRGFDLVVTARRRDRLDALAAHLNARHRMNVVVLPADLSDPRAPQLLCDQIAAAGLSIDVLVNNAGYVVPGAYARAAWPRHAEFLQVMTVAYCELAHRLLAGMVDRRWGRIINVASLAGLVPGMAGHTLYGASKSFLIKFSQSLGLEVARHGVHVTAVCPGYTWSEFHDVAGVREQMNRLPGFMWMDAETVARQGVDASEAGRLVYVNGTVNKTIALLARAMPERLLYALGRGIAGRLRGNSARA